MVGSPKMQTNATCRIPYLVKGTGNGAGVLHPLFRKMDSLDRLAVPLIPNTPLERVAHRARDAGAVVFRGEMEFLGPVRVGDGNVERHVAGRRNDKCVECVHHLHRVAERVEAALGDERISFVEGCPQDWAALPRPPAALTVGIDGCYIRDWEDKKKNFEIIVGKSMSDEAPDRRFGSVQTYDEKPKRRLFELLKEQGMQLNQQIRFFSDGAADIRDVQLYLNREAEHYLDWFHITMRIGDGAVCQRIKDDAGETGRRAEPVGKHEALPVAR